MSVYQFSLSNYRAIKHADIEIDGITVLAGENGSGKSTLSRFIYYAVKTLSEYDRLIDRNARQGLQQVVMQLERASRLTRPPFLEFPFKDLVEYIYKNSLEDAAQKLLDYVGYFGSKVSEAIDKSDNQDMLLKRFATLFGLGEEETNAAGLVSSMVEKLQGQVLSIQDEAEGKKNERGVDTLFELISQISDDIDSGEVDMDFSEDEVPLIDGRHFSPLLNLNKVIYYKTYALMDYLEKPSEFRTFLESVNDKMRDEERLAYRKLRGVLGGDVVLANDGLLATRQLRFKREDGLEIPLKQAATGLVSFSYLLRLLENGYLREGTLLVIDEPEAHLHPRWVVEYAKALVMLQKHLGLKIVLSTHNPDMLAAIDAVARKQGVLNTTRYYFATPDQANRYQYTYRKLDSIGDIFDSFNTALVKIQEYGQD